ncbi:branched-chain amino acid ABC transporter permease [Hoeflea prorocentri]|uniref:Branched-chain amino acid ABC transporter permease n=2 Tax=Hoeflea prorocentri TaxID=1922333 RepID=A0A9X3UK66_9HYPH|nr:branched-chain amino acid ABC transporter permease [Hoeflea prorocentri]MCY6382057.1 branched-chain amino acid ABC transporter permease [Hoeflea prorocentri]MDA5399857.1 branched-chain amino acid ABC transporter permease [Hoeflea prorocentri]
MSTETQYSPIRDVVLFAALGVLILFVFLSQGPVYSLRMMVEAGCYAIIALGLTIQWGYAGLFNVGIMGFIAAGAATSMIMSFPRNEDFWASAGPSMVGLFIVKLVLCGLALWAVNRSATWGLGPKLRALLTAVVIAISYLVLSDHMAAMSNEIESASGWMGGLGLPVVVGWIVAGIIAGAIAWFVGKICLGLRADYLAIATLGIAQIIKTFLKNADWLTRGTLTVSPLPWPVQTPSDGEFIFARASYLTVVAIAIVIIYLLLQRAYNAPWGRMMRAIRDNENAASSMGKNVNRRRLEIFVLGCVLMGFGGAVLIHFASIYDPSGFLDLNHTFLVWVMVILGGSGNNRGAIFGAVFVYIIWVMSEPVALWLFSMIGTYGEAWLGWEPPSDLASRALQMRVFVIGLTITLVLRFAPQGVLPERQARH